MVISCVITQLHCLDKFENIIVTLPSRVCAFPRRKMAIFNNGFFMPGILDIGLGVRILEVEPDCKVFRYNN